MKLILIVFSLLFVVCCKENASKNKDVVKTDSAQQKGKPPSNFQDSLFISQPSAIFFEPDSVQFQKLKAISDEKGFQTNVHESFFQFKTAKSFLQQHLPLVKILSARNSRYLVFKPGGKIARVIDLDKVPDAWGLYFFEPGKDPRLVDMMSIDTEAPNYFSK
jgi:hypothetical protein